MHPVLFTLPNGAPVHAYGTLLGLAFYVGWLLTPGLAVRDGMARRDAVGWFVITAISALVGSKVLYVVTNPEVVHGVANLVTGRGLVAYGGFLGGLLGAWAYGRARGLPFGVWADAAVPSLCTGLALTRVGCLLAGCDFGAPWNGPWAIQYPRGSIAFAVQRAAGSLPANASVSLDVHPTPVYESLAGLLLLALVLVARARRRSPGEAAVAFFVGYAVFRFCVEFVRGDPDRGLYGPFSTSQWIALGTCAAAAVLFTRWRRATGSAEAGGR